MRDHEMPAKECLVCWGECYVKDRNGVHPNTAKRVKQRKEKVSLCPLERQITRHWALLEKNITDSEVIFL